MYEMMARWLTQTNSICAISSHGINRNLRNALCDKIINIILYSQNTLIVDFVPKGGVRFYCVCTFTGIFTRKWSTGGLLLFFVTVFFFAVWFFVATFFFFVALPSSEDGGLFFALDAIRPSTIFEISFETDSCVRSFIKHCSTSSPLFRRNLLVLSLKILCTLSMFFS